MSPLYVRVNLGMGDMILCNGLVRELHVLNEEIILPAYAHNLETVKEMFSDLEGVSVLEVDEETINYFGEGKRVLKLGHYHLPLSAGFDVKIFDQEFYRQAGIPFEKRWSAFKLPMQEDYWTFPDFGEPHAFVHQDVARGFKIDLEKAGPAVIIEPDRKWSFFRNVGLIQGAKEVHCINSSFLILTDSLPPVKDQKLFLHHYARPTDYPSLKKDWVILK